VAAQGLATYLVIRMWLENVLPAFLLVKNIKRTMRLTLSLWLVTAALGVFTYIVWYVAPVNALPTGPADPGINAPAATEEVQPATLGPVVTEEPDAAPDLPSPEATAELDG